MSTEDQQLRPPSSESLAAGYETSGVSIRALAWFVVGLAVCAAVIHAGIWVFYERLWRSDQSKELPYSVAVPSPPPAPLLQPSEPHGTLPRQDLQNMYLAEDELFRRMGWKIEPATHDQVEIPANVMAAVLRNTAQGQQPHQ